LHALHFPLGLPERAFAAVAASVAAIALIFWSTSASMVSVWNASGTYSHGYFVVPAFLWLVWGRRQMLSRLPVAPAWWALLPLAIAGGGWLISQWMVLAQPAQFAMVTMVPLAIASVLGMAWVRALAFPLAFLYFAVPFGESWVPVLMDWTADFTVAALKLSRVPVYRDGLHFEIPNGKWSVVDSCSGIRYLFACLSVSSLYAWTIYRGRLRRLTFVGLSLLIAIVANWLRAYGIVMLGHLSNNQIATGADHLVYGALFFGVIMALVFALGAFWREDREPSRPAASSSVDPLPTLARASTPRRVMAALATALVLVAAPLLPSGASHEPPRLWIVPSDIRPSGGWLPVGEAVASWQPRLNNPAAVIAQSFEKHSRRVSVHLGLFERPTLDSKLTSGRNRLLEPDGLNPQWKLAGQGFAQAHWAGSTFDVRTGVLVASERRLLAWHWYWVDGIATTSPTRAALLQILARLRGRSEVCAWISAYTAVGDEPSAATRALQEFVADMSTSIGQTLAAASRAARRQDLSAEATSRR
jgi:exosortase A